MWKNTKKTKLIVPDREPRAPDARALGVGAFGLDHGGPRGDEETADQGERRQIEGVMKEQALAATEQIQAGKIGASVCVFHPDWHQGVVGLVASRLKEKFFRPTLAFAPAGDDELRGSGRSIPDVHLRDVLDLVSKRYPGLIRKFGGHAMAAGVTLRD